MPYLGSGVPESNFPSGGKEDSARSKLWSYDLGENDPLLLSGQTRAQGDRALVGQPAGTLPSSGQRGPTRLVMQALEYMIGESGRRPVLFLEGGHFDPRWGADDFSRTSLEAALDLGMNMIRTYGRGIHVVFGILQDNLGLDCGGPACALGDTTKPLSEELPADLEERLAACPIVKRDRVKIFGERAAKNRGIRNLRLLLNQGKKWDKILRLDQGDGEAQVFLNADDGESILLARHRATSWTANCPLIMGQHFSDVVGHLERRFSPLAPVLLVDYSKMADRNKVVRGSELALRLLVPASASPRRIINVFYADNLGRSVLTSDFDRTDFEDDTRRGTLGRDGTPTQWRQEKNE